ncbi:uncharacterized protein LOC133134311 [Conger conger]|uniref:uncharacterized protein LOC133134311 n=1 Tax=Conger conger TaxID=82655 RepID=UPI002A5AD575|nr:uncharacterized protein LOC133134311 [Conger conger]
MQWGRFGPLGVNRRGNWGRGAGAIGAFEGKPRGRLGAFGVSAPMLPPKDPNPPLRFTPKASNGPCATTPMPPTVRPQRTPTPSCGSPPRPPMAPAPRPQCPPRFAPKGPKRPPRPQTPPVVANYLGSFEGKPRGPLGAFGVSAPTLPAKDPNPPLWFTAKASNGPCATTPMPPTVRPKGPQPPPAVHPQGLQWPLRHDPNAPRGPQPPLRFTPKASNGPCATTPMPPTVRPQRTPTPPLRFTPKASNGPCATTPMPPTVHPQRISTPNLLSAS